MFVEKPQNKRGIHRSQIIIIIINGKEIMKEG